MLCFEDDMHESDFSPWQILKPGSFLPGNDGDS